MRRVRVEPVSIHRGPRTGAELTRQHRACKWSVGEEDSSQRQEHGDVWLRDGGIWLPHVGYVRVSVGVEEVVIGVMHTVGDKQDLVVITHDCVVKGECKVSRLATGRGPRFPWKRRT